MDSDRTPSIDVFLADLKSRRDLATGHAAEEGFPELATVLLTVAELDRLLDVHVEQDSSIMIHEFHTGVQSRTIRTLRAREEALRQAAADHPGPLADKLLALLDER
ncbi:hypothetical protein [Rhodococcus rhodochrous]|uniref:Uncharacterized protein n=1 Tax=Rhodococcus rhodochrous J45 TaxID=935266 RepID=A0A562E449_RHORH|nr:hypothetical protein [Rhodococcus rhodochrous]TWH16474.1 hypothetical protein L618_002300000100 [Rhodococcus rhodochrous J45]